MKKIAELSSVAFLTLGLMACPSGSAEAPMEEEALAEAPAEEAVEAVAGDDEVAAEAAKAADLINKDNYKEELTKLQEELK